MMVSCQFSQFAVDDLTHPLMSDAYFFGDLFESHSLVAKYQDSLVALLALLPSLGTTLDLRLLPFLRFGEGECH